KAEYLFIMTWFDAHSVVAHKKDRFPVTHVSADLDDGMRLVTHEFAGIVHQILPDLQQTGAVTVECDIGIPHQHLNPALGEPSRHHVTGRFSQLSQSTIL